MNPCQTYKLYGGEIELTFENDNAHIYRVNGEVVPGVTTVIGVLDKPALKQWTANMATEYVASKIKPGRSYDEIELQSILNDARFAYRKKADKAANIGSLVHEWIERWIKGEKPEMPFSIQAQNGVNAFLEFINSNNIKFLETEQKIYSKKYKYAGTFDFIAEMDGKRVLGDIKTSSGIYPEMFYQVSAYQQARQEEYPDVKFDAQVIVNCKKDGNLNVEFSDKFENNIKMFLACLTIYNGQQEAKNV